MTSVFIVRPFGKKPVTVKDKDGKDATVDVDFTHIDKALIKPALAQNGFDGKTTEVIAEAGNIRIDMFQMLIASDLVIADISIDNANVFYELGIRHGLRPNGTILLRFPTAGKDVPFDLKTDRYVAYDRQEPEAAVDALAKAIRETIQTMRRAERHPDSPVFLLLPNLVPPDRAKLLVVPREFQEAVEHAAGHDSHGATTLALLAEEAKLNAWAPEGLRLVGRAQWEMRAYKAARETWECIRRDVPDDIDANLRLATIHQRLGNLVASSQACRRVLDNSRADRQHRADAWSQLARNDKSQWVDACRALATAEARRQQSLSDDRLFAAYRGYRAGFAEDLNDYYSGINALGLLTVIVNLAEMERATFQDGFESEKKAEQALDDYREQLERLSGAVHLALENARRSVERGKPDPWLPASEAQYRLLTAAKAGFVRNVYRAARTEGGANFYVDSEASQVAIYLRLGLFTEKCEAALAALGITVAELDANAEPPKPPRDRVIIVTGHRADAADRPPPPRFPNTPEAAAAARAWLKEAIAAEVALTAGKVSAIGGAASGTDLLFHEVCQELGIPAMVVLPIPPPDYCRASVADGGHEWVERFNKLIAASDPVLLGEENRLPAWVDTVPGYNVFQRGNIWMLKEALLRRNADVTLIALWNGKSGDGPGGTADMIKLAEQASAKVIKENTDALFGIDA